MNCHIVLTLVIFSVCCFFQEVKSQNCSVLSSVSAGSRFALGYDEPVMYSADICKDPFEAFSWRIANRTNDNSRTDIVTFSPNSTGCLQTGDIVQNYSATCMRLTDTCYQTNLTYSGGFSIKMDETWFELQFAGFNETCFSTPYPHINVHECQCSYPNFVVADDSDSTCGYNCSATISCADVCEGSSIQATCRYNATWSELPVCDCPVNECQLSYADVIVMPEVDGVCGHGCKANLTCKDGCSGDPVHVHCRLNGTWSQFPSCSCKKGLSQGAVAGIVIGTLLAVVLIGAVAFYLWKSDCSLPKTIRHENLYNVDI